MKLLIDLRTGEPAIGLDGELTKVNIDRAFRQYIDVLFHTPLLSEPLVPTWGLDIGAIINASSRANWESLIKYIILDSLSQQREPLVDNVKTLELSRSGSTLEVDITVQSKYGTETRDVVELSV